MTEWQPIETVPKDGTTVLFGFAGKKHFSLVYWNLEREAWFSQNNGYCLSHDLSATHWLPVPPPPEVSDD